MTKTLPADCSRPIEVVHLQPSPPPRIEYTEELLADWLKRHGFVRGLAAYFKREP